MTNSSFVNRPETLKPTSATVLAVLVVFPTMLPRQARAQVNVSISPKTVALATLATRAFSATVTGTTNTAVTWQVSGVTGGNSATGLISTTILGTANEAIYLAPALVPSPATVSVTAVSQADPTKSASATVTVQIPSRSGLTYYVAVSGSDSNPGTLSAPWRHINYAASKANPGDTVQVMGGTYNEIINIPRSGNATSGYITFMSYPGQTAIVDGTGLNVGSRGQTGLFSIAGTRSYIIIQGFEIRNFQSSTRGAVPVGIDFEGAGSNIEFLQNHIHNIAQTLTSCSSANALGVAVYGTQAPAAINNLTFWENEVDHNTTGCSENVSFDGNVQYFVEANNKIHDGDNIGLDNIGFEGVSPNSGYDQARDGWVFQNTVYNISSSTNPVYHHQVGADGYYCDGCTRVIVERNVIHNADLSEIASEHSGHVSSYVMFRNNLIYNSLYVGLSMGGYSKSVGGTDHCIVVNNTLWHNGTYGASGLGEFQIQYYATNNSVYNNIFDVYTLTSKYLVYDYTSSEPGPALLDYNDYYNNAGAAASLWNWQAKAITGYAKYRSSSGQDAHSPFLDPQFVNLSSTPPDLDVASTSPAVNAGTNLGVNTVGVLDYAGNPRVNGSGHINIGAYEQ
ncbi:MAG: DUF5123 domain-containing protein [Acidobacteria bacterium]|nr:DUF5123 domain-containing protein [Acidobacteriota bacterium]